MPHSGGGGSHSGGGHHGGSHHSSGSRTSSGSNIRISDTPFTGCHTYAVYDKTGASRLVYTNKSNYRAEMTKSDLVFPSIFGAVFMLPGVIEFIVLICILVSCFHVGVRATKLPSYVDSDVCIIDTYDLVSAEEEAELKETLEDFRDKTGIIPAVEFTTDEFWMQDYYDMESFAYNEYVCNFYDEYHLLIVYSYGEENQDTGFNEFHWESMWGDDLGKTAKTSDEDYLADRIQANLSRANGEGVAEAIGTSFKEFFVRLDSTGFRIEDDQIFLCLFMVVHGGIFFAIGLGVLLSSVKKYKKSKEKGEITYKINGEVEILKCEYCGTTYYRGTIGNCPNCGAPLSGC